MIESPMVQSLKNSYKADAVRYTEEDLTKMATATLPAVGGAAANRPTAGQGGIKEQ